MGIESIALDYMMDNGLADDSPKVGLVRFGSPDDRDASPSLVQPVSAQGGGNAMTSFERDAREAANGQSYGNQMTPHEREVREAANASNPSVQMTSHEREARANVQGDSGSASGAGATGVNLPQNVGHISGARDAQAVAQSLLDKGIVNPDETYIGGIPKRIWDQMSPEERAKQLVPVEPTAQGAISRAAQIAGAAAGNAGAGPAGGALLGWITGTLADKMMEPAVEKSGQHRKDNLEASASGYYD